MSHSHLIPLRHGAPLLSMSHVTREYYSGNLLTVKHNNNNSHFNILRFRFGIERRCVAEIKQLELERDCSDPLTSPHPVVLGSVTEELK